jgi:probable rRNA maturation factor
LGDLALCPAVIEQEATDQGKKLEAHWAHLIIHGLFHLLGYDHRTKEEAQLMEELEIKALEKLGLPNPYLVG